MCECMCINVCMYALYMYKCMYVCMYMYKCMYVTVDNLMGQNCTAEVRVGLMSQTQTPGKLP